MRHVFESNPYGSNPFQDPEWVKQRIIDALSASEWVAIGSLYPATARRVKRELLHSVLKDLLNSREITMRLLPVAGAKNRTEFKRLIHPNSGEAQQ